MERQKSSSTMLVARDLAIVILGIIIALSAEAWWQSRADREDEASSLARLVRDLEDDVFDLSGNLERARTGLNAARWISENRADSSADVSELKQALFDIGHCSTVLLNSSEYTSLRNSGAFRLIRDKDLLQRIAAFYEERSFLYSLHERDCADAHEVVRLMMPYVQHKIPPLHRPNGGTLGWGLWDQPMVEEVLDPEGLLGDEVFFNSSVTLATDRQFLIEIEERFLRTTQELQAAIEETLE
jgi:hypothetical protein